MRKLTYLLGGGVLALGMALAGAGAASASPALVHAPAASKPSVVIDTNYQQFLAGYQVFGNGLDHFNEVRGTVALPASEVSTVPADSIADGLVLQARVNGGKTAGLAFVYDVPGGGCLADQWTLEAGYETLSGPGPIVLGDLTPLQNLSAGASPVCLNGGTSAYLEIHLSTKDRILSFLEGPNEYGDYSDLCDIPWVFGTFQAPAVGTDVTSGPDAQLVADPSTQATWSRVGLTQESGFGKGGVRVTLNGFSLQDIESTLTGNAPTESNPITLSPSGFGAGSAFSVNVP